MSAQSIVKVLIVLFAGIVLIKIMIDQLKTKKDGSENRQEYELPTRKTAVKHRIKPPMNRRSSQ